MRSERVDPFQRFFEALEAEYGLLRVDDAEELIGEPVIINDDEQGGPAGHDS